MILTGEAIARYVASGEIIIDPFEPAKLEPNSYKFGLDNKLLQYTHATIDSYGDMASKQVKEVQIDESGYVLWPGRFYLGATKERMGSVIHAAEIYARLSTSLAGIFIQTSAPLGHTGAVIPWTLEITVAHAVRIYPDMPIGKICFWVNHGVVSSYVGRYRDSNCVEESKLSAARP
jgi:dCTP deaminase